MLTIILSAIGTFLAFASIELAKAILMYFAVRIVVEAAIRLKDRALYTFMRAVAEPKATLMSIGNFLIYLTFAAATLATSVVYWLVFMAARARNVSSVA